MPLSRKHSCFNCCQLSIHVFVSHFKNNWNDGLTYVIVFFWLESPFFPFFCWLLLGRTHDFAVYLFSLFLCVDIFVITFHHAAIPSFHESIDRVEHLFFVHLFMTQNIKLFCMLLQWFLFFLFSCNSFFYRIWFCEQNPNNNKSINKNQSESVDLHV